MKTCPYCTGELHRHGASLSPQGGERYRCKVCFKTVTVRNGKLTKDEPKKGRPLVSDWRMQA